MEITIYDYIISNYNSFGSDLTDISTYTKYGIFIDSIYKYIDFKEYLERLAKYMNCSHSNFFIALIYLNRLKSCCSIQISKINIRTLYFIALYISVKWNEDDNYSVSAYSKIGGFYVDKIIDMEIEFLKLIDFNAYVSKEEYDKFVYLFKI